MASRAAASRPPATASAAAHPHTKSASGFIIDVDELPDSSGSVPPLVPLPGEDLGEILLSRLQAVISTLPSSVPAAQNGDLISTFAVDPTTLILPARTLGKMRGPLGMNGFFSWLEICFNQLHISPAMVENRVERIIQAMMLLGSTVSPPSPPTPTNSVARKDTPATVTTIAILGCPGQELLTESDRSSFLSYPLGAHADRQLPWSIEFGDSLVVRSKECKRHTQLAGICFPSRTAVLTSILSGMTSSESFHTAGMDWPFTICLAVSKGDIPRIHSITSNHFENGGSIFSLMEKLGRAVNHAFQDQSYTLADHQRLYLFLKLGGTAAAELAHRTMGLPSINAAKRHIASVPLIASPKGPTMDEMTHNLKVSYPSPHPKPLDRSRGPGFQMMIDEIKVEARMRWYAPLNQILGICREHSKVYELEFRNAAQKNRSSNFPPSEMPTQPHSSVQQFSNLPLLGCTPLYSYVHKHDIQIPRDSGNAYLGSRQEFPGSSGDLTFTPRSRTFQKVGPRMQDVTALTSKMPPLHFLRIQLDPSAEGTSGEIRARGSNVHRQFQAACNFCRHPSQNISQSQKTNANIL
ncbi:hypothetical protein B0H10DRAFT_1955319 [Mycena sp. CBHHK59/15]|nr:hypothetical protein B0H10DRAFT_1955319 [Mycena sp. CBHHK59/15]